MPKFQRSPTTGKCQRNPTTGKVYSTEPGIACCCGCSICNAQCLEVTFEDWVGQHYHGAGDDEVEVPQLNSVNWKLKYVGSTGGWCNFQLICPIDETIDFGFGSYHYELLILFVRVKWVDSKLYFTDFQGQLTTGTPGSGTVILKGPTDADPAVGTVEDDCYELVTYQTPGTPSPNPDSYLHFQILEGVSLEDCVTESCPDNCENCCPDVMCIVAHIEVGEYTFGATVVPAQEFDLQMIRGFHYGTNAGQMCLYGNQCDTRFTDETGTYGQLWGGVLLISCDLEGNPFLHAFQFNADTWDGVVTTSFFIGQFPQPSVSVSCGGATVIDAGAWTFNSLVPIGTPDTPPEITITLTPSDSPCDPPDSCAQPPTYRQLKECGGSLVDKWILSTTAAGLSHVVVVLGVCYEIETAQSETPGTLITLADIEAQFEDCEGCACPEPCVECNGCDPMCMVGATLTLHYDLTPGECAFCDTPGPLNDCGYCCPCEVDPDCFDDIRCGFGGPGLQNEDCDCFNQTTQAGCETEPTGQWHCDPDCLDETFIPSICSFIDFQGDTTLTYTGFSGGEIHFGVTLTFGSDVVVFDVWFNCTDERWYAEITVNTRCLFTGDINGGCFGFTTIVLGAEDTEIPDHVCSNGGGSSLTDGVLHLLGQACP